VTAVQTMVERQIHVSVVGYNEDVCTKAAYDAAYRVGHAIAAQGGIVVCGGLGGVMEAASRGAHEAGGLSIGIIPSADSSQANEYCDVVIATGLGKSRNFLVAYSGDAMIIVGGGAGTLIEAAIAYQVEKPIVAIRGSGGVADTLAGKYLDDRHTVAILGALDPEDAVKKVMLELVRHRSRKRGGRRRGSGRDD
jgi:uncharacterized protein (TIGR00725 family)